MNYLLGGDLGEEKSAEKGELVRKLIEDSEGLITRENRPQKQNLSYAVKNQNAAYFGSLEFIFPVEKLQNLEKSLEKSELLRFLLTQKKQKKETGRRSVKRFAVRRPLAKEFSPKKEFPLILEGEAKKEPVSSPASKSQDERPPENRNLPPLQVEEIDKKLEELLGE